jgi:hypothetical protein
VLKLHSNDDSNPLHSWKEFVLKLVSILMTDNVLLHCWKRSVLHERGPDNITLYSWKEFVLRLVSILVMTIFRSLAGKGPC